MVFSSLLFIFIFLPVVLLVHTTIFAIIRKKLLICFANTFLLFASIIFYGWGEPQFVAVIIAVTIFNFILGLIIARVKKFPKIVLLCISLGIMFNLGLLFYFKYANFFLEIINIDLSSIKAVTQNIVLPLGISFYIFQAISYLVDIARNETEPSKNFINFACYLTMFPQLVAGPIVRYSTIESELLARRISLESFKNGIIRFIYGLAKKVLIADTLGRVADAAFAVPHGELPATAAWLGIVCYTFQIFYDFSGYSDMAIGMGKMLGFTFPENFNYPYISKSIKEFWQRWHMTLSNWFKDYLYIPLGGNRKSKYRVVFNLCIVFILCGLWHGSSYNFLLWGLYYGLFLSLERLFPNMLKKLPLSIQHIYTMLIVTVGWVLFRANDLNSTIHYYKAMLGMNDVTTHLVNKVWLSAYGFALPIVLVLSIIFSTPITNYLKNICAKQSFVHVSTLKIIYYILTLHVFIFSLTAVYSSTYKTFIYFRF